MIVWVPAHNSTALRTQLAERRIALVGQSVKCTWECSSVWNNLLSFFWVYFEKMVSVLRSPHTPTRTHTHTPAHTPPQPLSGTSVNEITTVPFEATQLADVLAGDENFLEGSHVEVHGQPKISQGDPNGMDATPKNDEDLIPPTQPDPPSPFPKTGDGDKPAHAMSPTTMELMAQVWVDKQKHKACWNNRF